MTRARKIAAALAGGFVFASLLFAFAPAARAQGKPLGRVDLDCKVFAVDVNSRVACAAYRLSHFKKYTTERDDIWLSTRDGKKKRIVDGDELVKSPTAFSYTIQRLAFSPDGHKLTVQMTIEQVVDEEGNVHHSELVDLMTDEGKEIPIAEMKTSVIEGATQANWLADEATVAYLKQNDEVGLLYQIGTVAPASGKSSMLFDGHYFSAVAWDAPHSTAIAIERDKELNGPIHLVRLDLVHDTDTPVATLPGYLGQLSVSPSGQRVAYYRDGETLEIRSLQKPDDPIDVRCAYGQFGWSDTEDRILLKRGSENELSDLNWLSIPGGTLTPILHDLAFHAFAISPDSHTIVVAQPGDNRLLIYPLP
jgi:hypothetical protein